MELGKQLASLRNPDTRVGRAGVATTTMVAAFALWVSGCGADSNGNKSQNPVTPGETSGQTTGPSASHESHAQLTFDYLGGGSKVIMVYPGVGNTPHDKKYDGTYYDGEHVPADCKTGGREVHSDPSIGEQRRQSDEWIRIEAPGEAQYATAVYTVHPHQLLMKLPEC